jgi:NAD(P)-dependent dehydrogenase (short-subunit alcohol dehydrogenase family)
VTRNQPGEKETVAAHVDALDLVVNNAAVNFGDDAIADLTARTVINTFRVNTVGPVLVAQRFGDSLKKGDSPKVINISSEAGSISNTNHFRGYSYSSSKAALNMFTRVLAWDKGLEGIIVAAKHPGWVRTDMGGEMAPLSPAESAKGYWRSWSV